MQHGISHRWGTGGPSRINRKGRPAIAAKFQSENAALQRVVSSIAVNWEKCKSELRWMSVALYPNKLDH